MDQTASKKWLGIGLVVVVAIIALLIWNKQRHSNNSELVIGISPSFARPLQVAADEARRGHSKLAAELRELIEKARAPAAPRARAPTMPLVQPRGALAELLTAQYPQHPLKHMVLSREVEQKLQRVLLEQRQHERLSEHGLAARRKLLLVGPPGTGKTMTAAVLATELKLPLFTARFDSLIRLAGHAAGGAA